MSNLCIIPARGGSKRIPKKNIKDFLGKPIIAYSIEAAIKCNLFDEVMVSTDDEEIAQVAILHGANVPFIRSKKNANDYATTTDVLFEVLEQYQNEFNITFTNVCCIYPTAPLLKMEDVLNGYNILNEGESTSVFPVTSFGYPVLRGLKRDKNGLTAMVWPEHQNTRSQDLEEIYHDAGQWYWFKPDNLLKKKSIIGENYSTLVLNKLEVQDIDTMEDWKLAELKYKLMKHL